MELQVYGPNDIMEKLRISKASTYRYLKNVHQQQEPFRVIHIGNTYRIPCCSFDEWLDTEVYKIKEIQTILGISYTSALELVHTAFSEKKYFPVLKVLTLYRIPKDGFELWLLQGNTA